MWIVLLIWDSPELQDVEIYANLPKNAIQRCPSLALEYEVKGGPVSGTTFESGFVWSNHGPSFQKYLICTENDGQLQ